MQFFPTGTEENYKRVENLLVAYNYLGCGNIQSSLFNKKFCYGREMIGNWEQCIQSDSIQQRQEGSLSNASFGIRVPVKNFLFEHNTCFNNALFFANGRENRATGPKTENVWGAETQAVYHSSTTDGYSEITQLIGANSLLIRIRQSGMMILYQRSRQEVS